MPKFCESCDYQVSDEWKVYQQERPTLTTIEVTHCPVCGDKLNDD